MAGRPLSIRSAWMIWTVSLVFAAVCVSLSEFLRGRSESQFGIWQWALVALGVWIVSSAYRFRRKCALRSAEAASRGAMDLAGRKRSAAQLFGLMSAINVVICGVLADLVLHSPVWFGASFYAVGVGQLLWYRPATPSNAVLNVRR